MITVKPTVPEVAPLVRALYARWGGGAGCCLHVVLDDGNVEDSFVDHCIESARELGHGDCLLLGYLLRDMSKTQRIKLGRIR